MWCRTFLPFRGPRSEVRGPSLTFLDVPGGGHHSVISPSAITSPLPLCIDFLCVSYLLRLSTPVKTFLKTLRRLKHSPSKTLRSEVNFLSFFSSFFLALVFVVWITSYKKLIYTKVKHLLTRFLGSLGRRSTTVTGENSRVYQHRHLTHSLTHSPAGHHLWLSVHTTVATLKRIQEKEPKQIKNSTSTKKPAPPLLGANH